MMLAPTLSFPAEGEARASDPVVRQAIHKAFKGICFWTRRPITLHEMHIDHVWPLACGGPDNVFNFVPSCAAANLGKSARIDVEALTAVLTFVRLRYAPKVLSEIKLATASPEGTRAWWKISDHRIRRERRCPLNAEGRSIFYGVEVCRRDIAAFLRKPDRHEPNWNAMIRWADESKITPPYDLPGIKRAWACTIMASRWG